MRTLFGEFSAVWPPLTELLMADEDGEQEASLVLPLEAYVGFLSRLWGISARVPALPAPVRRVRGQILLDLKEDQGRVPVLQALLNHAYVHLALAVVSKSDSAPDRAKTVQDVLLHLLRALDPSYVGDRASSGPDLIKMAEAFFAEEIDIRIGKVSDEPRRR